jgi:hypothetical protein
MDSAIAGLIFAWLYNAVTNLRTRAEHVSVGPSHN